MNSETISHHLLTSFTVIKITDHRSQIYNINESFSMPHVIKRLVVCLIFFSFFPFFCYKNCCLKQFHNTRQSISIQNLLKFENCLQKCFTIWKTETTGRCFLIISFFLQLLCSGDMFKKIKMCLGNKHFTWNIWSMKICTKKGALATTLLRDVCVCVYIYIYIKN